MSQTNFSFICFRLKTPLGLLFMLALLQGCVTSRKLVKISPSLEVVLECRNRTIGDLYKNLESHHIQVTSMVMLDEPPGINFGFIITTSDSVVAVVHFRKRFIASPRTLADLAENEELARTQINNISAVYLPEYDMDDPDEVEFVRNMRTCVLSRKKKDEDW